MTVFPHADVSLREELDNMQNELATMVLEATKLKNEKKRRQLHPECYGVAHLVSLRGDVVTCAADPYAHDRKERPHPALFAAHYPSG